MLTFSPSRATAPTIAPSTLALRETFSPSVLTICVSLSSEITSQPSTCAMRASCASTFFSSSRAISIFSAAVRLSSAGLKESTSAYFSSPG